MSEPKWLCVKCQTPFEEAPQKGRCPDCGSFLVHPPKHLNMRQVFIQAIDELAKPFPSITLNRWSVWNKLTGGFRMREFSILCGPTGKGKTTFLANLSAQLLEQRVKHFVMSVETGHTDYMKRVLSAMEGEDLNTGDPVGAKHLAEIAARHVQAISTGCIEFSLYEDRVPVEQLKNDLLAMAKIGCRIAFIDNLNFFMEVTRDPVMEMDRVIHELIIFCKQVDMHIVMVMHPKKTEHGRVESEFDIKGSATAVQEAHNVFLFNPPRAEAVAKGASSWNEREIKIAKMRRRGKHVGSTIVFENRNTLYQEKPEYRTT